MSTFYTELQAKFSLLQADYPDATMENVLAIDILQTEGLALGAKFKIVFTQGEVFLTTVYVMDDGVWFMSVNSAAIKKAMRAWVTTVHLSN